MVLEAGLGGRLDATNIVVPDLTAITSVGYDHMEALGNTLEGIALEKAGIIKPQIPVVIGKRVPEEIIEATATSKGSKVIKTVAPGHDDFMAENNAVVELMLIELQK